MHFTEKWAKVEKQDYNFPRDYYISNKGRIKSVCKTTGDAYLLKGSIINHYKRLTIRTIGKTKRLDFYVHRFIAEQFLPNPNSEVYVWVRHKDGNLLNNAITNLEWIRKSDAGKTINHQRVRKEKPNAKLTAQKVQIIRQWAKTTRLSLIAKKMGVSVTQIKRVLSGENWADVEERTIAR